MSETDDILDGKRRLPCPLCGVIGAKFVRFRLEHGPRTIACLACVASKPGEPFDADLARFPHDHFFATSDFRAINNFREIVSAAAP